MLVAVVVVCVCVGVQVPTVLTRISTGLVGFDFSIEKWESVSMELSRGAEGGVCDLGLSHATFSHPELIWMAPDRTCFRGCYRTSHWSPRSLIDR